MSDQKKATSAVPMTLLDRAIGYLSPAIGTRRLFARAALTRAQAFEGATSGRRTRNWNPGNNDINSLLSGGLPVLRARSRDLVRNNAWANRAVEAIASEVVGKGIIPQAKGDDKNLVQAAESLWIDWGDKTDCDADGLQTFYGIQALVMKTVVEAGSCLVRRRYRREADGYAVPMQLQVLDPEFLDTTRDMVTRAGNGNIVIGGVEFDVLGRRRGYWLYRENPLTRGYSSTLESTFVPADDIIHVFRVDRSGQVDGIPWGSPAMIRMRDLDEYEDAERVRQKVAACFAGFIYDADAPDVSAMTDTQKAELGRMEPGILEVLPPGKDIKFSTPPATTAYVDHVPWQLRAVAAAYGITYELLTNDYSKVNYSSGRMGRIAMMRNVERWDENIMKAQLCNRVWSWFVDAAITAGRLRKPVRAVWTSPRREMVDPTKETAALRDQVRSGFKSLSEAIREGGRDPAEVYAEKAADNAELDRLELIVDSDPRVRSAQGISPGDLPSDQSQSQA